MPLKMYILIRDDIPDGFAFAAVSHAPLALYLKHKDNPVVQEWLGSFRKVVCRVTADEFEQAKQVDGCLVITESALDHKEAALVFVPREEWPKAFKFYRLAGK